MDIYFKKRRWKRFILLFAVMIGIGSLIYTNSLVREVSDEEMIKAKAWGDATRILAESASDIFTQNKLTPNEEKYLNDIMTYLNDVITSNETIPIIVADEEDNIVLERNFGRTTPRKLERELARMKQKVTPIEIYLDDNDKQYLYYKESSLLVALRYYPIFQLIVIVVFILVAYYAFSSARKAEQDLVWVGMAKETAHQLGTPISSLIAWVELLRDEDVSPSILDELSKDTNRLKEIADRFSKVGSSPELIPANVYAILNESVDYLKKRVSKKIEFKTNFDSQSELYIPMSAELFGWVIENLVRNSVDAMDGGNGMISINVNEKNHELEIDVSDNGRGISKSKAETIFRPGYTTKKRGWGLGLSLSRRIINQYHKGKLFLKSSEPNVLTTFRIIIKKQPKY